MIIRTLSRIFSQHRFPGPWPRIPTSSLPIQRWLLCCGTAILAINVFSPGLAWSQQNCRARLQFQNNTNTEGCPNEHQVRSGVAGRLGYDPFCDQGPMRMRVSVERQNRSFAGEIALQDNANGPWGRRRIAGNYPRCEDLASALTLAMSIAIDPLGANRGPPSPPPAEPDSPPPAPVPPNPFFLDVGIGTGVSFGNLPKTSASFMVAARTGWYPYSLTMEGQALLPVTAAASTGRMKTSVAGLSLVPCYHQKWASGCVLVSGGMFRAEGQGFVPSRQASTFSMATGLRGAVDLNLFSSLGVRLHATAAAPLIRTHLKVSDNEVWKSPVIWGALGALFTWNP